MPVSPRPTFIPAIKETLPNFAHFPPHDRTFYCFILQYRFPELLSTVSRQFSPLPYLVKRARFVRAPAMSVCPPFKLSDQMTGFHETWYERWRTPIFHLGKIYKLCYQIFLYVTQLRKRLNVIIPARF
jgi:hypothetical protein